MLPFQEVIFSDFSVFLPSEISCGSIKDLCDASEVTSAIRTAIMSKQYGNEDFLAKLVAQACSKYLCAPLLSNPNPKHSVRGQHPLERQDFIL